MRFITTLLVMAIGITARAAPLENGPANSVIDINIPTIPIHNDVRYRCGSFKFDDGTTQDMVSQVWGNVPGDKNVCRRIQYSNARKDGKAGKDAHMIGAKIDKGCTCFFYEIPCEPGKARAEAWPGWAGFDDYAYTDKPFKGWWCRED